MRDADPLRRLTCVIYVLSGAAGAGPVLDLALIVELHGDADHVIALLFQQRRHDRGIHPARHGDNHPRVAGRLGHIE